MNNIINSDKTKDINIQKYQFNRLDLGEEKEIGYENIFSITSDELEKEINEEEIKEKPEINNELLEKIDALTSQIVTLQMELDKQKKDFEQKLEIQKETLFNEGKEEGIKETAQTLQTDVDELKSQLINSITALEEQQSNFNHKFKDIEEDLIESAIIIAKKVIKKEIELDSTKIAQTIASALVASVKNATLITLKVNKSDFVAISEQFNQDSINIIADDAVSPGGVIILNNDINIDATISTRLNQALDLIGKE